MEKRLGKKVYRKMPTMQVMTGCLCITVCNDAGVRYGSVAFYHDCTIRQKEEGDYKFVISSSTQGVKA